MHIRARHHGRAFLLRQEIERCEYLTMTRTLTAILLLLSSCVSAQNTPPPAARPVTYVELAAKLEAGDPDIDYDVLRTRCTKEPEQCHSVDNNDRLKMMAALRNKKYEEVLLLAEGILRKNRTNLWANMVGYTSANQMGNKALASYYDHVVRGLLHSITGGRDGRSAKTSWNAIEVGEEYATLSAMQMAPRGQSASQIDGHNYDVMKVVTEDQKEPIDIYFNTDVIWAEYDKIFKRDKKK